MYFSEEDILTVRAICAEKGMEITPQESYDMLRALALHLKDRFFEVDSVAILESFRDMIVTPP